METNIMCSSGMIKKFVKDCAIPIQVFESNIFKYFLMLYEPLFSSQTLFNQYLDTISKLGGENEYSSHTRNVMDAIIADISSTEGYHKLQDIKHSPVEYSPLNSIAKKNIYHNGFDGKTLISIDMKKANFNSLKLYDSGIVLGADTYDDLISKYTPYPYIIQSKQIRQVIFGNLLPGKQASIQKTTMHILCDNILNEYPYMELSLSGTDEIIVYGYGNLDPIEAYKRVMDCIPSNAKDFIKTEIFTLEQVHTEKPYFVKKPWKLLFEYDLDVCEDANITMIGYDIPLFKNVPITFFVQVFKHYFGMEMRPEDLMFYYEGYLAKFNSSIYDT